MSAACLPLSVIVVGSGTAGLTCALALAKSGHKVKLLERNNALRISGGSYRLNSNAMRLLEALGLRPELEKCSRISPGIRMRRYDSGEPLYRFETDGGTSYVSLAIERQSAGEVLYRSAVAAGVEILFGKRVVDVDEATPAVKLEDGSIVSADLIVGADGANSVIRRSILEEHIDDIIISDQTFYNVYVPREKMESDEDLSKLWQDAFTNWWIGPGAYAICGSDYGSRYYIGICLWDTETTAKGATWYPTADLAPVHQRLANFDPLVHTMLRDIETAECWRIVDIPHLDSWRSKSGKVVLIGDAAHAMGPHAAQGAAMGVEDAFALAEIASRLNSVNQVPRATRLFEKFRKPRVEIVVQYARRNGARMTLPDGPEQEGRDRMFRAAMDAGGMDLRNVVPNPKAPPRDPAFNKWLYDYDTIEQVVIFLAKSSPFTHTR